MRLFKKLFPIMILSLSVLVVAALSGCYPYGLKDKYGGNVNSFYVDETYITIKIDEEHDNLYCYPSIFIYESHLKNFYCKTINELLSNEEYIANKKCDWVLLLNNGEALAPSNFLNKENDKCICLLIYSGMDYYEQPPESFYDILEPLNYIGYIKFN